MSKPIHRYRVTAGRTAIFPLDMMRFACCWPWASTDVIAIERSIKIESGETRQRIELGSVYEPDRDAAWFGIVKRWDSFGWTAEVIDDDDDESTPRFMGADFDAPRY